MGTEKSRLSLRLGRPVSLSSSEMSELSGTSVMSSSFRSYWRSSSSSSAYSSRSSFSSAMASGSMSSPWFCKSSVSKSGSKSSSTLS